MSDTFLNQNLYESIIDLCRENSIAKISNLTITVHKNSHIKEETIRKHFAKNKNGLVDRRTNIQIQKQENEPLIATIDRIDGEKYQ